MWFSSSNEPGKNAPLVVIIDDDIQMVAMLRSNLEAEGYHVEFATDGISGKQLILKRRPDLILSDIFMPGVDGLAMLESIHKLPGMTHIPVIFMSGRAMENFVPKPKDPTMKYALLKKPIFLPELNQLVKQFLP